MHLIQIFELSHSESGFIQIVCRPKCHIYAPTSMSGTWPPSNFRSTKITQMKDGRAGRQISSRILSFPDGGYLRKHTCGTDTGLPLHVSANCFRDAPPRTSKTDEFSEKFRRGWVIFNPKIYIAKFGPLDRAI